MKIVDVMRAQWANAARTSIRIDFRSEQIPQVPINVHDGYDTEFGQELWDKANAGHYGPILAYIPPSEWEVRARMPELERWRFNTIVDLEPGLREKIDNATDKWPEPKRTIAKNKIKDVQNFSRLDNLFDEIGADPEIGKTPEDIDVMWEAALALV